MHLLAGVTHGDIAPSNIVVDVDDTTGKTTATLVDFGGSIMGKVLTLLDAPLVMAPPLFVDWSLPL